MLRWYFFPLVGVPPPTNNNAALVPLSFGWCSVTNQQQWCVGTTLLWLVFRHQPTTMVRWYFFPLVSVPSPTNNNAALVPLSFGWCSATNHQQCCLSTSLLWLVFCHQATTMLR
jgi:hypothetical protein